MTDAQVEAACATLKRAIEAAENSNQAGEDFVMAAAAGPALLEALETICAMQDQYYGDGMRTHMALIGLSDNARAAIAKAKGAAQ